MIAKVENFGVIDYTYEHLRVNGLEIRTNIEMSMVLKALDPTKFNQRLTELSLLGYDCMYDLLIDWLEDKGLA